MNRLLALVVGMTALLLMLAQGGGVFNLAGPESGATDAASVTVADLDAARDADGPDRGNPLQSGVRGGSTVLDRGADGQFHVYGRVDGGEVRFLVDTGADMVALTVDEARRLGIDPPSSAYQPILRTASGQGYGAVVRIDRLAVDGREIGGIEAVVVRDLSVNLLGQSALKRLGKVTLEGDRLVISAS